MKNIKQLPKQAGIYLITNNINGHSYIGQAIDIYDRFNSHHIYDYKNPKCRCYNTKIYQALRKYGLENFTVEVLEFCCPEELDEKEKYYVAKYNTYHTGYNSTEGGQSWSENIHSPETEEKRRITREKNQSLKSENHPRAKLTNEEVIQIRQRYIDGETMAKIHQDYIDLYPNINVLKRIILGKTYTSVGNIPTTEQVRHTNAKLTDVQVREIRQRYQKGKISYAKLGAEYGVTAGSIASIIQGKSYKHVK